MPDFDFEKYFMENYNTELTPDEERLFNQWLALESSSRGKDMTLDMQDYDLKGYWKSLREALLRGESQAQDSRGHMTDKYKKPNHPTFSDGSQYNGADSPWGVPLIGGHWSPDGKTYEPSDTMLKYTHPVDFLKKYMKEVEPGTKLILKQTTKD